MNRLPTKHRLKTWGILQDDRCALCGSAYEDIDHLFGSCSVTVPILQTMLQVMGIHCSSLSFQGCLQLIYAATRKSGWLFLVRVAILCNTWKAIWRVRNMVVFHSDSINHVVVCRQIGADLCERLIGYHIYWDILGNLLLFVICAGLCLLEIESHLARTTVERWVTRGVLGGGQLRI